MGVGQEILSETLQRGANWKTGEKKNGLWFIGAEINAPVFENRGPEVETVELKIKSNENCEFH